MYPSSSCSETGFAISASRRAVVSGDVDDGIRERNSPVWEDGSRTIGGRVVLFGIEDVVLRSGFFAGLEALFPPSASPLQQNRPKLLFGFGFFAGRGASAFSATGFRRLRFSTSSRPNLSANVSMLVRSFIVVD